MRITDKGTANEELLFHVMDMHGSLLNAGRKMSGQDVPIALDITESVRISFGDELRQWASASLASPQSNAQH